MTVLVGAVALFFAGMGAFALAWPERVVALFGTPQLGADGRNEVRAVYGGFGLAVAGLLAASLGEPAWARGAWLAVAVALLGMAAGRVVSLALDREAGFYPWLFLGIELVLAAALLAAVAGEA